MTEIGTLMSRGVERINRQLHELRRSFDDDVRSAPPEDGKQTKEFVLLTLSGEAYAYPVAHAHAVLRVPPIVPVPGVPPAVAGIINFRGQILSVTTIHGLLGLNTGEPESESRIIVTKNLPLVTGILVDSVQRIAEFDAAHIQPLPATIGNDKARLLAGQICLNHQIVFLLDMEQLCESESLRVCRVDSANETRNRRVL